MQVVAIDAGFIKFVQELICFTYRNSNQRQRIKKQWAGKTIIATKHND
jgi:hypothetical protein